MYKNILIAVLLQIYSTQKLFFTDNTMPPNSVSDYTGLFQVIRLYMVFYFKIKMKINYYRYHQYLLHKMKKDFDTTRVTNSQVFF